jgi:hypothetical protein
MATFDERQPLLPVSQPHKLPTTATGRLNRTALAIFLVELLVLGAALAGQLWLFLYVLEGIALGDPFQDLWLTLRVLLVVCFGLGGILCMYLLATGFLFWSEHRYAPDPNAYVVAWKRTLRIYTMLVQRGELEESWLGKPRNNRKPNVPDTGSKGMKAEDLV